MEAIVKARKEANEERKMVRNQDAAAEERRLAAEERRVAAEERKVALEERKVSNEERTRLLEWEKHLFFLDTSILNEAQKEYVNLAREEVLIQKKSHDSRHGWQWPWQHGWWWPWRHGRHRWLRSYHGCHGCHGWLWRYHGDHGRHG